MIYNDKFRKFVYVALVVLALVSLVLAIAVTAGVITDAQVGQTLELWLKYALAISGAAGGILAIKNFTPRD